MFFIPFSILASPGLKSTFGTCFDHMFLTGVNFLFSFIKPNVYFCFSY